MNNWIIKLNVLVLLILVTRAEHKPEDKFSLQGRPLIKDRYPYPTTQDNVNFGTGYNSIMLEETYNTAVDFDRKHRSKRGYIQSSFKISLCKSKEEFQNSIEGSLSLSGSFMEVDASSRAKFLTETQMTSLDTVLIISVDAITDTEHISNVKLNDDSKTLLEKKNYTNFVATYGTHYLKKIIIGGKMRIVMKFSSKTAEEKTNIDAKFTASRGSFNSEGEFKSAMKNTPESSTLSVKSFTVGGNVGIPEANVEACIKYASDFAESVLTHPAVRQLEYVAFWTISGNTGAALKNFIFPLQKKTDEIVHLSVDLLNVQSSVDNKKPSYFSEKGWEKIKAYCSKAANLRKQLQDDFKTTTSPGKDFDKIIQKFVGKAGFFLENIDKLMEDEKRYDPGTMTMKLKSAGIYTRFISTQSGKYPRLNHRVGIPFKMENVDEQKSQIEIGGDYIYITSKNAPGQVLCMGRGSWYTFWVSRSYMNGNPSQCQWRLASPSSTQKRRLSYGDKVILYNKYWMSFIIGQDWKHEWLAAAGTTDPFHNKENVWIVQKP